jgi:hypothetical protein
MAYASQQAGRNAVGRDGLSSVLFVAAEIVSPIAYPSADPFEKAQRRDGYVFAAM